MALGCLLTCEQAFACRTGADQPELAGTARVRWANSTIAYEVHEKGAPSIPFSAVQAAVANAARSWASVSCGGPDFNYRGLTSNHAVPYDGRNTIEWVGDWTARGFQADAAGQTDVQYEKDEHDEWRIVEADPYLSAENHSLEHWGECRRIDPRRGDRSRPRARTRARLDAPVRTRPPG